MIKKIIIRINILLVLWMLVVGAAWAGAGSTGASFLLLGAGARPLAMGEAYVALADDASSIYWNPAGLSFLNYPEVLYMYNQWFIDIKHQNFDVAFPTENGTFAGAFTLLDSGDILGYDSGGAQTTTIKASDSSLGFAWGRSLNDRFSVGIGLKYISETLENYQGNSTAIDLGLIYKFNPAFSIGAAMQNIGSPVRFITEDTPLPMTMRLGMAYKRKFFEDDIILATDYVSLSDQTSSTNLGFEYLFRDILALRTGSAGGNLTAGVGLLASFYRMDYAYLSHNDLGATHQVSVSLSFGSKDTTKAQILEYLTLAKAYYNEGKFPETIIELEKALKLDPENADARSLMAKAKSGLEGGSVEKVKEEIEAERESEVQQYLTSGKKFMAEKQYLEAITEYNKALKVNSSHPETVKLVREAHAALEAEVSEKVKKEAETYLGSALKYITTGEYEAAEKAVEQVLKIDPGNVQALKLYKKLQTIIKLQKK